MEKSNKHDTGIKSPCALGGPVTQFLFSKSGRLSADSQLHEQAKQGQGRGRNSEDLFRLSVVPVNFGWQMGTYWELLTSWGLYLWRWSLFLITKDLFSPAVGSVGCTIMGPWLIHENLL